MRIGLISDIHANLPALEAVLDDMPSVDEIICAGCRWIQSLAT